MPKLVRVLIYEGEPYALREHINRVMQNPIGLDGKFYSKHYSIRSSVVLVEDVLCIGCQEPTNNTSLICDKCQAESLTFAEETGV